MRLELGVEVGKGCKWGDEAFGGDTDGSGLALAM